MEKTNLNLYEVVMTANKAHQLSKIQSRFLDQIEKANYDVKTDDVSSLSMLHYIVSNLIEELQTLTDMNLELTDSIVKMIEGE
ncbi:hypothetical protein [Ruoffia sp. FAM 20858]|uniref:hypothetical protein n=1 Tax=Ruoffia sp. FAM 20858 TaxID=3259516 RepID=UPI003886B3B8